MDCRGETKAESRPTWVVAPEGADDIVFKHRTRPSQPLAAQQPVTWSNMNIPLFHVDAFTEKPFAGNPAAVCLLPSWPDDAWLQAVAAEMNLSETAFLVRNADGFGLRWLTPTVEVDLCGHATLAPSPVLLHQS